MPSQKPFLAKRLSLVKSMLSDHHVWSHEKVAAAKVLVADVEVRV
jgi:hypothetical protein